MLYENKKTFNPEEKNERDFQCERNRFKKKFKHSEGRSRILGFCYWGINRSEMRKWTLTKIVATG